MDTGQAFLLLEATATIFMAGVLWTMQLLNYPLLANWIRGAPWSAAAGVALWICHRVFPP